MKSFITVLIFGFFLSNSYGDFIKTGKEYIYNYEASVAAGSQDYASFASVFNVTGKLRVQKVDASLLTAQLEDLQFAAYNGEFSYFNRPETVARSYQQLNPLKEPIHIRLGSNNLVEGVTLSGNIPEWARNVHRGIATFFQLDYAQALSGQAVNYDVDEKTVAGNCPTSYQVVKSEGAVTIQKQRNHARCENRAIQYRVPGTVAKPCQDENTRDVYNSSAYGIYKLGKFNGEDALTHVRVGSSLIYEIFGVKGHVQYSFTQTSCTLTEVKGASSRISQPSSPQTFGDLRYVFESQLTADDPLDIPRPYFFHYAEPVTDESILQETADKVYENIKKLGDSFENAKVYDDLQAFHRATPFSVIPGISVLPYNHLKTLNARIKQDNDYTTSKMFLDALVVSGSGPAALLIRDIVGSTTDTRVTANLIAPLPNYIRNPTEKLLREFEGLIKPDLPKHNLRIIEFAFASLISRTCTKYECKQGYVDKYVKYFSDKYDNAPSFEEKTVAIGGLRNLGLGGSIEKLISIVKDASADRSVRVAAMSGLYGLPRQKAIEVLLPIFYDRSNHHELRNRAAAVFLVLNYDETAVQQMVIYMWSERCPYVKNFLFTLLEGLAYSTSPCVKGASARSVLAMFPPWKLDRTKSSNYIRDFHDREFNFGHMTYITVEKSGESALPTAMYASLKGHIAGFGASYLSVFARVEGLGKAVADRVMSMSTGQINFDDIKQIFSTIGVKERARTPLRLEFALLLHNRVVAYHAADASTVTTIPEILKKLKEMKSSYELELSRMFLLGGATIEQATEFGTPVSTTSGITSMMNFNLKTIREKGQTSMSQKSEYTIQGSIHGLSHVANHFPAFNTMHFVSAHRDFRFRVPRKFNLNLDWKAMSMNFGIDTPTKEDPFIAMTHATAVTSIRSDRRLGNNAEIINLLKGSCSTCNQYAVISKGDQYRGSRQIGFPEVSRFKIFEGVKRGAKYFDCEKPHTRHDTIKRILKFISPDNKNAGQLGFVRFLLAIQYARDYMFFSPTTHTCGIKAYYHRDPEAKSIFEKVEGTFQMKYQSDINKKLGLKLQFKGALNFKHGGPEPQTRNVDVNGQMILTGMEKREVKLRFAVKNEKTGKTGLLCIESTAVNNRANTDFFDYEGQNEPGFERNMMFKWGEESSGSRVACSDNGGYIKTSRKSHRSMEQLEEAKSNGFPYKECREQKRSAAWPGSTVPPTHECMQAAVDQTNLRESNITIEYQVDVEARNRWRKPLVAVGALLLPYWDTEKSAAVARAHSSHIERRGSAEYVRGSVEIDVSARKLNPSLDIHWHASHGDEHFHNVDMAALPGPFKVKPVFSRFSPFYYEMFKTGLFGYCAQSPATVITFDNNTYSAPLTECPTLLAADCDNKPRFAILSKKLGGDRIGVTAYLGEHRLELNDLNSVIVDGKAIPATEAVYTDEDEEKLFKFLKFNPNIISIVSEKLSVYISYSGSWVTVTAGSRYRNTACGLCGNFDFNPSNDFMGPDPTCKGLGPETIVKAYTLRERQCSSVGNTCPV